MISYDDLFQVCVQYTAQNYFVGEVIPESKISNARKRYPIPAQERVVALVGTTVFGSAKTGLGIGISGLYWRNFNLETKRNYISWNEFASLSIEAKGILTPRIEMGQGVVIELSGSTLSKNDVVQLLAEVQHLARSPSSVRESGVGARKQWMLAMSGSQFGPYDIPTIRAMLAEGRIDPDECWAWQDGWRNWIRFNQVPTLADLLGDTKSRLQSTPPPLPTSLSSVNSGRRAGPQAGAKRVPTRLAGEKHQAQIDLNNAAEEELLALPSISLPVGRRLVQERDRRGGFDTVEEAGHFLELQPHQVQRLKERARIRPQRASQAKGGRIVDF